MNMLFLINKTKDQISLVSSHDLYWENKMYKRKRSIVKILKDGWSDWSCASGTPFLAASEKRQ